MTSSNKCPYKSNLPPEPPYFIKIHHARSLNDVFFCHRDTPENYFCSECDFSTPLRVTFNHHKNRETFKEKNYHCHKCNFSTFSILIITKHYLTCGLVDTKHKSRRKWYECGQCRYRTRFYTTLHNHKNAKHANSEDLRWFRCEHCDYKAKRKRHLQNHLICRHLKDEEAKWFECDRCPYRTKRKDHLGLHAKRKHLSKEDVQWYECDMCTHKTTRKEYLKQHVRLRHAVVEKWHECDLCSYKAKRRDGLRRHKLKRHSKNVWSVCLQNQEGFCV